VNVGGKRTLFFLLAGLACITALLFRFMGANAWRLWNVPVMSPSFADMRSILAGVEAERLGYDPLYQNPLDPFGRVMAYPRLWLLLGMFNLNQNDTVFLAGLELALFVVALFVFLDHFDRFTAFLIALLAISPAAMLCYERANNDLIAFFLLACALALAPLSRMISFSLIELTAFLKLYPIVALSCFLRESKKSLVAWLSGGLAIFGLYALLTWRDIRQILAMAPKGVEFNYGVTVIGLWVWNITGSRQMANIVFSFCYLLLYVLMIFLLHRSYLDRHGLQAKNLRALDAFRVGVLIYIATFLQGNTWNYRFIFLVFAVPQLVEWSRTHGVTRMTLASLMISAWAMIFQSNSPGVADLRAVVPFLADEISNWSLLAGLTYLLFASLPDWIREEIRRFFLKYTRRPAAINP
jgi:hypothetical protein